MTEYVTLPDAEISRETEKACLLLVGYSHACGHGERKVWFPKSQMTFENGLVKVAAWLLSKKETEVAAEYRGFYSFNAEVA